MQLNINIDSNEYIANDINSDEYKYAIEWWITFWINFNDAKYLNADDAKYVNADDVKCINSKRKMIMTLNV